MAEKPNSPRDSDDVSAAETPAAPKRSIHWTRFLGPKWVWVVVGLSLLTQAGGLAYFRWIRGMPPPKPSPEATIGPFHFEADQSEGGRISQADFTLHVGILEPFEQAAHEQLTARKFRIREDIEQLLRKAHSGDFEDPLLADLKRQFQEKINETLGTRMISEAIITDLKIGRETRRQPAASSTAGPFSADPATSVSP